MKSLAEKVQEQYPDFAEEVEKSLTPEQMDARISSLQKQLEESEDHKDSNEQLKDARALVAELAGPYNDVKKAVRLKTKYLIELLKEKGK